VSAGSRSRGTGDLLPNLPHCGSREGLRPYVASSAWSRNGGGVIRRRAIPVNEHAASVRNGSRRHNIDSGPRRCNAPLRTEYSRHPRWLTMTAESWPDRP
jgi:hypothetical protein